MLSGQVFLTPFFTLITIARSFLVFVRLLHLLELMPKIKLQRYFNKNQWVKSQIITWIIFMNLSRVRITVPRFSLFIWQTPTWIINMLQGLIKFAIYLSAVIRLMDIQLKRHAKPANGEAIGAIFPRLRSALCCNSSKVLYHQSHAYSFGLEIMHLIISGKTQLKK